MFRVVFQYSGQNVAEHMLDLYLWTLYFSSVYGKLSAWFELITFLLAGDDTEFEVLAVLGCHTAMVPDDSDVQVTAYRVKFV